MSGGLGRSSAAQKRYRATPHAKWGKAAASHSTNPFWRKKARRRTKG